MSVLELPYGISSLEEVFQDSLRRVNISIDELRFKDSLRRLNILIDEMSSNFTKSIKELRLEPNKVHERMVDQLQNSKIQMRPQAVPVSVISLSKVTYFP